MIPEDLELEYYSKRVLRGVEQNVLDIIKNAF